MIIRMNIRTLALAACALVPASLAAQVVIHIDRPMAAPAWALQERALLGACGDAAREFAAKYVDDRGFLRCVERWGGNDGPDDAMENFQYWPLVYALGGPEPLIELYRKVWEGHLAQYTKARAPSVEMAREGMYYKEFITSFDWEHNGEGLAAFEFYSLAAPRDPVYVERARRFAGFYLNEDPGAPNYDSKLKIIRSLHNGSRGPKLTPASIYDWGGEPVPGHPERLEHYKTAANIRGDHPLNLLAATLAINAYMLTGERKYRDWVLEYAGAWRDRVMANGGNIPTNIGLDGTIGGEWGGKWYAGTFGWNFWPQSNTRNYYMRGPRVAFGEAFLLTADASYLAPLRRQIANLYAAGKEENGRILLPNKYGEKGWYGYIPDQHFDVQRDVWLWSHQAADAAHLTADPWIAYLEGRNDRYPEIALRDALGRVRRQVERIRADQSTPDTRASDYPQAFDPVAAAPLTYLTTGGNDPGTSGNILHARVFWFDWERRRAGLPEDVAALVEKIGPDEITVTVVNANPVYPRTAVLRMGAYGEHQCESVAFAGKRVKVNAREFRVALAPGAGETLAIKMRRYANQPSLDPPW
jgi:hypothetical protein